MLILWDGLCSGSACRTSPTHGAHILNWRLPPTCGETSSRRTAQWTGRPWRVWLRHQGPEHESPKKGGTPGTAHARAKQAVGRPTDISKKHKGKQKRGEWKRKSKTKTKKIANADRRRSNSAEGKATNIKKALKVSYASCRATYCSEEMTDKRGTTRPHHKGGQRFGLRVESQATPIQPSLFEWAHSPCLRYTADDAQRNFNRQLCDLKSTCRYNRSCLNQVAK